MIRRFAFYFHSNGIDEDGARQLASLLAAAICPLHAISLGGNPFGKEGGYHTGGPGLIPLRLVGVEAIAQALRTNTALEVISWRGGREEELGPAIAAALGNTLAKYNDSVGRAEGRTGAVLMPGRR